jgi:hypothetical protein
MDTSRARSSQAVPQLPSGEMGRDRLEYEDAGEIEGAEESSVKIDPAFVQASAAFVAALAALMGAMYAVITRPLLKRMDDIRADLVQFKIEVRGEFTGIRSEVRGEFTEIRTELREIHTELKNIGERLTRVEERLPPPMVHR